MPSAPPCDWPQRWSETLGQLAAGRRHAEAAAALGIGAKAFECRLVSIRRRLGARNTVHAVALAAAHGLVAATAGHSGEDQAR